MTGWQDGARPLFPERAQERSTGSGWPRAGRAGTILYALGWTQHSHSVQLIHAAAMLQLLLGNIGMPGGGVNASSLE